ncbi:pullulanase [Mixta theicola]|uniref:Pullulanase n=1 Tax=Mixta theicola TaxID=1458355 RepID=A0A2K1QBB3_9GAMM|nr:type II secretion system pilot lipoprotein GspS [Mixta theicola]PNS12311.1 pullulanase [Mixta theicola]GLR08068.1 hypothetical protein GCM10007905_07870 [Mixta theicola]
MLIKRLYCTAALILLLTGCQNSVKKAEQPVTVNVISPESQVSQLAAVVAGGVYLRQQCQDLQVPERETLLSQVISLAEQRGWDAYNSVYLMLPSQSEMFYQGLLNDTTPLSTQCKFFKSHIGPLVAMKQEKRPVY